MDLLGKLNPGCRGAHDQHTTLRKLRRIAVRARRQLDGCELAVYAADGTNGTSQCPVAITIVSAIHVPRSVHTRKPAGTGVTLRTVVWVSTGAVKDCA